MNNTYRAFSQQDPSFIWLAGAALGSAKVGQNLQAASIAEAPIELFNHFVPPAVDPHFNNFQPPNFNFWW